MDIRASALIAAVLLGGCSKPDPVSVPAASSNQAQGMAIVDTQVLSGKGRDRLCLSPKAKRAGLIVYGGGNANCSLRGTLRQDGDAFQIVPDGDPACVIEGRQWLGDDRKWVTRIDVSQEKPSCAYYCAPNVKLDGHSFTPDGKESRVTDFGGDPLC
jgi:hypothetical protein